MISSEMRKKPSEIRKAQKNMVTSNITFAYNATASSISETDSKTTFQVNAILKEIASGLVQHPEQISIAVQSMATNIVNACIFCDPDDRKRLIGKNGATIRAMRTILHGSVARDGIKTNLWIDE